MIPYLEISEGYGKKRRTVRLFSQGYRDTISNSSGLFIPFGVFEPNIFTEENSKFSTTTNLFSNGITGTTSPTGTPTPTPTGTPNGTPTVTPSSTPTRERDGEDRGNNGNKEDRGSGGNKGNGTKGGGSGPNGNK